MNNSIIFRLEPSMKNGPSMSLSKLDNVHFLASWLVPFAPADCCFTYVAYVLLPSPIVRSPGLLNVIIVGHAYRAEQTLSTRNYELGSSLLHRYDTRRTQYIQHNPVNWELCKARWDWWKIGERHHIIPTRGRRSSTTVSGKPIP